MICTAADPGPAMGRPGATAADPADLAAAFAAAGVATETEPDPATAVARAIEPGPRAVRGGALRRVALPFAVRMDREARSELLSMMGLVAAVVAVVILVFFGLGYLFGRLFL